MFALGLWDEGQHTLLLARDPAGIKPLYYAELEGSLAFASELGALLEIPGIDRRLDTTGLSHFLSLGFVPAPWTIVRGVRQLVPGAAMRFVTGKPPSIFPYDRPISDPASSVRTDDRTAPVERFSELLLQAAADQLVADVPVGILLSGGVDSSLVAAAAARKVGKVRTFTVVHQDPRYDERKAARAVAEHIGSEHIEVEMPAGGLTRDELEGLIDHHGDPFADSSSLPTRRLAREVRKSVTVALSGDGGDELFCGYPRYQIGNLVRKVATLPRPLRNGSLRSVNAITRRLPASGIRTHLRRVARTLALSNRPPAERAVGTVTFFWPEEQRVLLRSEHHVSDESLARLVMDRSTPGSSPDSAEGCHRMEQRLILPDDMLVKVDRMTMAESLEIRPVLLDKRIVTFAAGLPMRNKLAGTEGKVILRELARTWVPSWVVDRPKMGFAVPLLDFGGKVLDDATQWALESKESPGKLIFTPEALDAMGRDFARRGDGSNPEDSAFRRAQRQWAVAILCLSLHRLGVII